jgi:hypothetical protein
VSTSEKSIKISINSLDYVINVSDIMYNIYIEFENSGLIGIPFCLKENEAEEWKTFCKDLMNPIKFIKTI